MGKKKEKTRLNILELRDTHKWEKDRVYNV